MYTVIPFLLIIFAFLLGILALAAMPLVIIAIVFGGWYGS